MLKKLDILITFQNHDVRPLQIPFSRRRDGKGWGFPGVPVQESQGGAVAMTDEPRRCRLLARIGDEVHVLVELKGAGRLPQAANEWSDLLQIAGVRPNDVRLTFQQVSCLFGLAPLLRPPRKLDRLLWRWQVAMHEAAHAVMCHGLGHPPTYVTIRPTKAYFGFCGYEPISTAKEITPRTRSCERHRAFRGSIDEALIALAGPIAEAASCGLDINDARGKVGNERHRSIHDGALDDWKSAEETMEDLLDYVSPETWSEAILPKMEHRVEVELTSAAIWPHIITLAEELMEKSTIRANALDRLLAKVPQLDALRGQCGRYLRACRSGTGRAA